MSEPNAQQSPGGRLSRRDAVRHAALTLTAFGVATVAPRPLSRALAEPVHRAVAQEVERGEYQPKAFLDHEWRTLRLLAEMILPADEHSGSAVDAGAPQFIDLLASEGQELRRIFTSGILWLDHEMRARYGARFADATEAQRHELLGQLAAKVEERDPGYPSYVESVEYAGFLDYTTEPANQLAHGLRFFGWCRRLVVDAFYTSPMGIADVGYEGNEYVRTFRVPRRAIQYALDRSPLRDEEA